MNEQPILSETDWALIVELLEQELHDLPSEIHHTRTNRVREGLRSRKDVIQHLLERIRPVAVG